MTFVVETLPGATYGGLIRGEGEATVRAAEADPEALPAALHRAQGLLVLTGMAAVSEQPDLLLRLSRLFGVEVEDYRRTNIATNFVHPEVPEIFIVSNIPPADRQPPARPDPPLTGDGGLPTRFPHRRGWHTDQSYRRPPPDISLFYCVIPAPRGQAQTLYANGIAAYRALPPELKATADSLVGIHAQPGTGRNEPAAKAGETPPELPPHQAPQRQPVVRVHPVTGEKALFLCEAGQMDWFDGPFEGMEPGPHGAGAKLLYELMAHYTRPEFTYAHEWEAGDLVVYDNRCSIHAATWYEADRHRRLMWRTTVWGNPGPEYAGEARSWVPSFETPAGAGSSG